MNVTSKSTSPDVRADEFLETGQADRRGHEQLCLCTAEGSGRPCHLGALCDVQAVDPFLRMSPLISNAWLDVESHQLYAKSTEALHLGQMLPTPRVEAGRGLRASLFCSSVVWDPSLGIVLRSPAEKALQRLWLDITGRA